MSQHNDGGPAFPVTPTDRGGQIADTEYGMTLRDYFAAKAMQGMLCNGFVPSSIQPNPSTDSEGGIVGPHWDYARHAYTMADAMIAAREAKP